MTLDDETVMRLEAAAFRRLTAHLRERTDVQNIDLMTLAGFCRNCLSGWLEEAAGAEGLILGKAEARAYVYGMPFEEWKRRYQTDASPTQQQAFDRAMHHDGPSQGAAAPAPVVRTAD